MILTIIEIVLRIVFFPVILLKRLPTLHLQTVLGVTIASYIYWPDEKWLIFPLCIIIAVNFFKFMTDVRDWVTTINDTLIFIGRVMRDKEIK